MKLLKMRGNDCLLYSAAMILDEDPRTLEKEIGHDGSAIWWPQVKLPYSHRGYHIQEIIDCCIKRGFGLVPIEAHPCSASYLAPTDIKILSPPDQAMERFQRLIANRRGILLGKRHACAWDGSQVYDPNGRIIDLNQFEVRECWILWKSNQND